jgi:hypothetical protein
MGKKHKNGTSLHGLGQALFTHPCVICGVRDDAKPMAWKRTPWCSGRHEEQAKGIARRVE